MRIALVVDPLTLGSRGGRHAPSLAQALIDRGHEVRGFGAPPGVVPSSVEYKELLGLTRFEADVLIAYDSLSPTAFSAARVSRKTGAPLLLVEPGIPTEAVPLHERFLQGIGERLWASYVRNTARHVVALDPVAKKVAVREGFRAENVTVLPEGIDLAHFSPSNTGSARRRLGLRGRAVLYAGPLETQIGLEPMINAFARTVGQNPDWCLVMLGRGDGVRALRSQVSRLGVASNVHWIEADPFEHPDVFATATLFVAPALDDRASARWVRAAMSAGLPVLAANIERYRWIVSHEARGLLVPNPTSADWEAALTRTATSPAARERWGRNGRAWCEQNLDWTNLAVSIEALLDQEVQAQAEEQESQDEGDAA